MFWFILAGLPVERAAAYHSLHGYLMCSVHIAAWICFAIGGLTYRPMLAPFCTCTLNPIPGLVSLVANIFIVLMSLPIVRRKNWEMFYLMGHLQLIPMITFGALFFDRVNIFPWLVLSFAQWGWADIPLRLFMKVMQHTQVLNVVSGSTRLPVSLIASYHLLTVDTPTISFCDCTLLLCRSTRADARCLN
jgi:hypothetical protein